jgi:fucose 4-O-acetylase-like acetyltransferase
MSQAPTRDVRLDVEWLRIGAAIGVVWYHMGLPGAQMAYAGLVIFVIVSAFYARTTAERSLREAVSTRAERILIPWLFWYLVYGALNLARDKNVVPWRGDLLSSLLAGPSIHLWYLPFIFLVATGCDAAHRLAPPRWIAMGAATIAMAALWLTDAWRQPSLDVGYPWAQYAHALPAVFIGLTFSGLQQVLPVVRVVLLSGIAAALVVTLDVIEVGVPYLLGFASCLVLVMPIPLAQRPAVHTVSKAAFGIYLVHPIFVSIGRWAGMDDQWWSMPAVFAAALFSVLLARKFAPRIAIRVT